MRRIRWTEAPDELAGTREGGKMDGAVSLESAGYVPVDRGGITFLLLSIDRSSYRSALLSFYSLSLPSATFSILPAHLSRVSWYFSGVTAARCSLSSLSSVQLATARFSSSFSPFLSGRSIVLSAGDRLETEEERIANHECERWTNLEEMTVFVKVESSRHPLQFLRKEVTLWHFSIREHYRADTNKFLEKLYSLLESASSI